MSSRIVSGVFWLASARAVGQLITWIVSIFVIRLLTPQDYGLMGMAILFTGFLLLFNEIGLGASIIRKLDLTESQLASLRFVIFGVNFILFLGIQAGAPLVARYFDEPGVTAIVRALGFAFILNGLGLTSGYLLQRDMKFKQKATAELIGSVVGGLSTLASAVAGLGVWSLVLGYLALQFTTNLMYCINVPPRGFSLVVRGVGEFMSLGTQVALSRVLWYISSSSDFLIVGRLLGTVQLGYYSLAFQFSSLPLEKMVTLITQVSYPSFAALQNDDERLKQMYLEVVSSVALVTFPIFLGIVLTADDAIELFLTEKWRPVVVPLQLLCIASCFRAVENLNAPLVLAKGQAGVLMKNSLLQAIVMPVSFYIGAQFGLVGVAISWVATRPVLFTIMTIWTGRVVGLSFWRYLGGLKHATVGSLVMVGAVVACRQMFLATAPPSVDLVVTGIVGAAVYLGYNLVFNQADVQKAIGLIRNRRSPRPMPIVDGSTEKHVVFSER